MATEIKERSIPREVRQSERPKKQISIGDIDLLVPSFDGRHKAFPLFWRLFSELVDSDCSLSETVKFGILLSKLIGGAAGLVESSLYPLSGVQDYSRAKAVLLKQYGDARLRSRGLDKEMNEIESVKDDYPATIYSKMLEVKKMLSIRQAYADVNAPPEVVQAEFSNVRAFAERLFPAPFLKKYDSDMFSSKTVPGFLIGLEKAALKEREDAINRKRLTKKQIKKCLFCESSKHQSTDCDKYPNAQVRKQYAVGQHICLRCLEHSQFEPCYTRSSSCSTCKSLHHPSLCSH